MLTTTIKWRKFPETMPSKKGVFLVRDKTGRMWENEWWCHPDSHNLTAVAKKREFGWENRPQHRQYGEVEYYAFPTDITTEASPSLGGKRGERE